MTASRGKVLPIVPRDGGKHKLRVAGIGPAPLRSAVRAS